MILTKRNSAAVANLNRSEKERLTSLMIKNHLTGINSMSNRSSIKTKVVWGIVLLTCAGFATDYMKKSDIPQQTIEQLKRT